VIDLDSYKKIQHFVFVSLKLKFGNYV